MAIGVGLGGAIALPTLVQRIQVDTRDVDAAAASIGGRFGAMLPTVAKVGSAMTKFVTLPILGIGLAAAKAAIDFESSFAGVRKTVEATEAEFDALAQQFRQLALEIPVSVNELNRIGELGGQLGVAKEQLVDFTRVVAQLAVTTNLSSEQAAEDLARFATILQLPQTQFENIGSTVVDLGNKFAGTESEIIGFGLRIAGAGKIAGLTAGEILGIGTAMASVGVEVERGGTAVQKVLIKMTQAVAQGGGALDTFTEVALGVGAASQQFVDLFNTDPGEAFTRFVEGLGKSGREAFGILEELELADQRLIAAFTALGGAGEQLRQALDVGNTAFEQNIALAVEAEKRFATFESRLQLFRNRLNDALIDAGPAILGALEPVLDVIEAVARAFSGLPEPLQRVTVQVGLLLAAIGPGLVLVTRFGVAWTRARAALEGTRFARLSTGLLTLSRSTAAGATAADRWAAAWFTGERATGRAATGIGRLATALRVLSRVGLAAAVLGLIELVQAMGDVERKGRELAATKFPGIVPDDKEVKDQEAALREVVATLDLARQMREDIGPPIQVEDIVDLSGAGQLKVLGVELDRLRATFDNLSLFNKIRAGAGFGPGAAIVGQVKAIQDAQRELAGALAAAEAIERRGPLKGLETPLLADNFKDAIIEADRFGKSIDDIIVKGDKFSLKLLKPEEERALRGHRDILLEAQSKGVDVAKVAREIINGNVEGARRMALGFEEAAEKGETIALSLENTREALRFANEDELKAFNERLKESTERVKELFDTIIGEKLELPELGLGDRVDEASLDAVADAEAKIADIHDRLANLDDKQREQRGRERAATLRDIEAAKRDLTKAERDLSKASAKNVSEGFESIVTSNTAFMRRFFSDIGRIAEAGFPLLASTLADMGVEGARIARDAVARIASGEGLGSMEQALVEAVLLSKRGLDGAIARFKPNIEEVAGDNIVTPLREKLNEVGFLIAKGLPPESAEGFLDIVVEEFNRLRALKGIDLHPIAGQLLEVAESAQTVEERMLLMQAAFDVQEPPVVDMDLTKFSDKHQEALRKLRDLGLLKTVAEISADPKQAFGQIGRTIQALTGIENKDWKALIKAIADVTEAERRIEEAARDRTVRIKAEFQSVPLSPYAPTQRPGTIITGRDGRRYRVLEDGSLQALHRGGLVLHDGGLVPPRLHMGGLPPRADEVDVRLLRNEFVVNPMSTRKYLPLLMAINNDRAMHGGGVVSPASPRGSDGAWVAAPTSVQVTFSGPVYADREGIRRLARELAPAVDRELYRRGRSR